jgi:predicted SprT family Zn-dependent metalloprotease
MRIPKRFKLLGATIEVVENPKLMNDRNWNGAACYDDHRIELLPITDATPRNPVYVEQTFCHELMHFLLHAGGGPVNHLMDKDYIHNKEEFVELMGNLLHQVLTTMEYE